MAIAALVTWVLTAAGGFYLLATWISKGGHRPVGGSRFPPALIFSHFGLAAVGLIVWIVYVIADAEALAWVAFVLLVPVALLGFTMLARWLPGRRSADVGAGQRSSGDAVAPAEQHFPVSVVIGHGLFAVVTVVLVLLTALGVGGS